MIVAPRTETVTVAQRRLLFQERIGATPDGNRRLWQELDALIVAERDDRDDQRIEEVAELCRHSPGLERAMMIVWEHHIQRIDAVSPCGICKPVAGTA
jgi:hypothetical protein